MKPLIILLVVLCAPALSQPYYFHHQQGTIYRTNLAKSVTIAFAGDLPRIRTLRWDPAQRYLFVDSEQGLDVFDIENPAQVKSLLPNLGDYGGIDGIAILGNKLYVTWIKEEEQSSYSRTEVFHLDDFSNQGNIAAGIGNNPIIDEATQKIYQYAVNEEGDPYIEVISFPSGAVDMLPFASIGPATEMKTMLGGHKGKALFSFKMKPGFLHQEYVTVSLETNKSDPPIAFPWRSTASLSPDASRIITEEVQFQKSPEEPAEYRPGNVYVFETRTGNLISKLSLPPEGRILLFENYPSKLFYLTTPTNPTSTAVPIDLAASDDVLMQELISLLEESFAKNWIGDHTLVKELSNRLENAKSHLERGNSQVCVRQLQTFQDKVRREFERQPTPGGSRFVSEHAYKLLWFNAFYLIQRLEKT